MVAIPLPEPAKISEKGEPLLYKGMMIQMKDFKFGSFLGEVTGTASNINIYGTKKIVIESFKKILECNDALIIVKTCDCNISIWGSDLKLTSYSSGYAEISGEIERIEIDEKKKKTVK